MWQNNRATARHAELVLTKGGLASVEFVAEEVGRIQLVVAQELINVAMKLIGAGLRRHGYIGARSLSEFRGNYIRLDLEFLNRINARLDCELFEKLFVVVNAVEGEIVLLGPVAAHAIVLPAAGGQKYGSVRHRPRNQ